MKNGRVRVLGILQARMSSSRLPGKVMKEIAGKPMLQLQLERLSRSQKIDRIIVATSRNTDDNPIAALCDSLGIDCFRGSLDDVLDRFYEAAKTYDPDIIVRLTGDCPLADAAVIDRGIQFFESNTFDLVTNTIKRTYPVGCDVEIFTCDSLQIAHREASLPSEREHVTPYIRNNPVICNCGNFENDVDLSQHRWTVDEPEDFEFVKAVYESLYPDNQAFTTSDILWLLNDKPELTQINYHIKHGAGYQKSLQRDKEGNKRKKSAIPVP